MAECSYARCVHERRAIKKELQRWTKNVVYLEGLERVAEELMGKRKWKKYQEIIYNNRGEEPEAHDWEPNSKCCFCEGGGLPDFMSPPSESSQSSRETPPATLPDSAAPSLPPSTTSAVSSLSAFESVTSMAASLAAVAALSSSSSAGATAGTPSSLLYPQFPWYLSPHLGSRYPATKGDTLEVPSSKQEPSLPSTEQPLDLSAKPRSALAEGSSSADRLSSFLRVPDNKHIFKAKPRMSNVAGRRTYTEEELQAALRDIQSGKLGTRRAAVIYGIPRSTLRNKVYKLAMEKERDHQLQKAPDIKREPEEPASEKAGGESEDKKSLSMEDLVKFPGFSASESLRHLLQGRKGGKQNENLAMMYPYREFAGLERSVLGPYISHLLSGNNQDHIKNSAAVLDKSDLSKFPLLPEFVRRMTEERLVEEQKRQQMNGVHSSVGDIPEKREKPRTASVIQSEKLGEMLLSASERGGGTPTSVSASNVILKIPSFKPSKNGVASEETCPSLAKAETVSDVLESSQTMISAGANSGSCSPDLVASKAIGATSVKEVIAKSITQRVQNSENESKVPQTNDDSTAPPLKKPKLGGPPATVASPNSQNNNTAEDKNAQKSKSGKGTRPKRGKYRNYDRDSLVEAVKAVQRGEMSVHRAGSYYGVPHSTLEYKVKERHLMRPRKREAKQQQRLEEKKDDADKKANKLKYPLSATPTVKAKPSVLSPPNNIVSPSSSATTNGLKIPPIFDPTLSPLTYPPFPFWPSAPYLPFEFSQYSAEQFFASQMMQRLQEDARQHEGNPSFKHAKEMAENLYNTSGSSLLDNLIRSSLEMGLPNKPFPDMKLDSFSDGTAPENMSNKALLDQLCKNSHFPPFTSHMLPENLKVQQQHDEGKEKVSSSSTNNNTSSNNSHAIKAEGSSNANPKPSELAEAVDLSRTSASETTFVEESLDSSLDPTDEDVDQSAGEVNGVTNPESACDKKEVDTAKDDEGDDDDEEDEEVVDELEGDTLSTDGTKSNQSHRD
uniref:E93 n=1 Tax=Thermobia domestica TaxID=89055 RepID=A0AA96Y222_THEDO|nr:E93 [Thermobia domestica]